MAKLTTRERMLRMFEKKEADRIPFMDYPWSTTVKRWQREGLPEGIDYIDHFDLDHIARFQADNSPQLPVKVIEETDDCIIETTPWGATQKTWKNATGVPDYLDFTVTDPDSWQKVKERMTPSDDRIPWDMLKRDYKTWRERGDFVIANFWFGFDITHSHVIGTERCLMAMAMEPEWIADMIATELDLHLELYQRVWDAGYEFDAIFWWDDMGYKHSQFFSINTYQNVIKPYHQKAIDWAHSKGIKAMLHSCGDVNPFVPELIDIGVDALNPLEVKAGMDPVHIKETFGDKLVLHGGINAVLWDKPDEIMAEMSAVIPKLKESGGYIFASDHSIPDSVDFQTFTRIIEHAKKLGSYE